MNQGMPNNVDLSDMKTISCECGNEFFEHVLALKEIPSFMSPTGQDMEYAIQLVKCTNCGKVRYPGAEKKEEEESKLDLVGV